MFKSCSKRENNKLEKKIRINVDGLQGDQKEFVKKYIYINSTTKIKKWNA